MQRLLTIIVPVYNVEKYINKCLDSCVIYNADGSVDEMMMNRLEVIIVNDGTPDQSAELSREYTKQYPQTFRQIDKENGGHGSAWNVGLREASGKYLRFLDTDDWLTNLDKLMSLLETTDADMVFTDYSRQNESSGKRECHTIVSEPDVKLPLTNSFLSKQHQGSYILNFWHTTYRTSILKSQCPLFAEKVMYDDSILCIAPLLYGRTYIYHPVTVYNYLIGRDGQSMDAKVIKRNVWSYIKCYQRMAEWTNNPEVDNLPEDYKSIVCDSVQYYAYIVFNKIPNLRRKEARYWMSLLYDEGRLSSMENKSKKLRMYEFLPFGIFWLFVKISFALYEK